MIVLDCETDLFGPARMAPPLIVLTVGDANGATLVHHSEAEPVVRALLESDELLVGHHVAYDMAVLMAAYPHLRPAVFAKYDRDQVSDTSIRQKLADLARGTRRQGEYNLAALAKKHFGIELAKGKDTWRERYGELRDIPCEQWPAEAQEYARLDVTTTARVYAAQGAPHPDEYRQTRADFWLRLMSCWGITTDPEAVERFADEAQLEYNALVADLVAAGLMRPGRVSTKTGHVIKPSRDTKAAMARMEAAGSTSRTATGRLALDDAACRESGDPVLVKYGEAASAAKVLSTDVPLVRRGIIHARFESLLETGRTSSSPNVQNLPRKGGMRGCFVPRPGHVYIAADYSQMELRTLAQVCLAWFGRSKLAEALNAKRDPHLEVAATILARPYADCDPNDPEVDNARQVAKVANFGFPGGLGAKRLVFFAKLTYGVDITEAQARRLKMQWLRAWPEMADYFERINGCGERIEQLYSGRWRGGVSYCEACNSPFQGLAADAAKAAGWLIAEAMYTDPASPLFDSRLVNFIHDEFIAECEEARAADGAEELARLMVKGASEWLPDVPPLAEPVVMRRWYKGAKPVRVNGRLVPSKPGEKKGTWVHDQ